MTKGLKKLPVKTWFITERVPRYKGEGLPEGVKPKIITVGNIDGCLSLQLTLTSYKDNEFEDILGYEIEDESGNPIGWTYTNTWTSVHNDFYKRVRYYIYAVDLKMNRSEPLIFEWGKIRKTVPVVGNFTPSLYPKTLKISWESNSALSNLLDGDSKTCLFTDKTGTVFDVGFVLDLQVPKTFQGFYYQNTRGEWGRTQRYRISISNDGENWTAVVNTENLTMPNVLSNDRKEIFFLEEQTARYFRYEQINEYKGTNHLGVCDFGLLTLDIEPLPTPQPTPNPTIEPTTEQPPTTENNKLDDNEIGGKGGINITATVVPIIIIAAIVIVVVVAVVIHQRNKNRDEATAEMAAVV
jgi:hypothetical protein